MGSTSQYGFPHEGSGAFLPNNRKVREFSSEFFRMASSQARSVSVTRSIPLFEVMRSAPARESAIFWAIPAARIADFCFPISSNPHSRRH